MADGDPRFTRLKTDPRFRRIRKKEHKVTVDPRFTSLFQDGSVAQKQSGPSVDKYGRRQKKTVARDQLRRFYRLDETGDDDAAQKPDLARGTVLLESSDEEDNQETLEQEEEGEVTLQRNFGRPSKRHPDLVDDIDLDESAFPELDAEAAAYSAATIEPPHDTLSGEETSRIAVVNLDWDHVQASDLFKVFSSVANQPGRAVEAGQRLILNVRIYPSEFGKERMKQEETQGPPSDVFRRKHDAPGKREDEADELVQVDEGEEYDNDALRKYQLERLRYYYAVVTCDSAATAAHVYSELDGTELERSANVLDLRYVPDGMPFDEECKDEATEDSGPTRALDFSTAALRHSKVKLTWDEDDPNRNRLTRRTLTRKEMDEADFKAYIASSGSEEEDGPRRDKLRSLLLNGADDDNTPEGWGADAKSKANMEITFMPGLSAAAEENEGEDEGNTLDKYQRRQKEKKAERRSIRTKPIADSDDGDDFFETGHSNPNKKPDSGKALVATQEELALILNSDAPDEEARHFDMNAVVRAEKAKGKNSKKGRRGKKGRQVEGEGDTFAINVADARFGALHEDVAFALDPTHPKFKRTKGMSALLEERSRRQSNPASAQTEDGGKHPRRNEHSAIADWPRQSGDEPNEQRARKKRRL